LDLLNYIFDNIYNIGIYYTFVCTLLCNPYNTRQMVKTELGKHKVEFYNAIDELPIARFHKYQKYLLIDAGIGGDIQGFDTRIEKTRRYLMEGQTDNATKELANMRQSINLILSGINPKHRAFATLVTKIDDKVYDVITDDTIAEIVETLSDVSISDMAVHFEAAKKKIDSELMLYFPSLFNDSDVKEYFDILKRRTLAILKNIISGKSNPDKTIEVEKLNSKLITYTSPKDFAGSEGVEVQFDRQYENLCLALSEQLHVNPKGYTVMEFYNAFDLIQERAKKAQKGA